MKIKRVLAGVLAAALAALAPGPRAYAALAEEHAAGPVSAGLPLSLPLPEIAAPALSDLSAPSRLALPQAAPAAPLELAQPAAGVLAAARVAAVAVGARARRPAASARGALASGAERLARAQAPSQRRGILDRIFAGRARVGDADAWAVSEAPGALARSVLGRSRPAAPRRRAAVAGALAAGGFALASSAGLHGMLVAFPVIIGSLILHEMGHAWSAYRLGDPTAVLQNRLSFKPRDLLTHIDPVWTVIVPLVTMFAFGWPLGGAVPVPVEMGNFRRPLRDMALVALAGPAVNFLLAAAASLAMPFAGPAAAVLSSVFYWNVLLGVFNLIPFFPLDGHHIARAVLPAGLSGALDRFYARGGFVAWMPLVAFLIAGRGLVASVLAFVFGLLATLGAGAAAGSLASVLLPAGLALGMLAPGKTAPAPQPQDRPVELVAVLNAAGGALPNDAHLSFVDISGPGGVARYADAQTRIAGDVAAAGLDSESLSSFNATPVATYRRINAATFRVDAGRADDFAAFLRGRGARVYSNDRRKIITPVPVSPESDDPQARSPVTMDETLRLTGADSVIAEGNRRWGQAGLGPVSRLLARLFGGSPAQPKIGVVDSGADVSHPLLKNVKAVVNVTDGENKDDIGHGTWVTSMLLHYVPWSRNLTHYKTFTDGGANLDDILKALTVAGNDGNLVISNSWGSDDGDPQSPDSQLVLKLAQEGHVMVFAAGNAGPGANTIGSPAIVQYRDAKTGAIRVVAVAAADRRKKAAYFSSRGPGSPATQGKPDEPQKPDAMAVGYNTEGAWPSYLDYDRVDPKLGPLKAISGTSMSTPDFAGAVALLATMFGVTGVGPGLDAVVNALMSTLDKTGQPPEVEGQGFLDVRAAYDRLAKTLTPASPNPLARLALTGGRWWARRAKGEPQ